jgi:hypothetical protein
MVLSTEMHVPKQKSIRKAPEKYHDKQKSHATEVTQKGIDRVAW